MKSELTPLERALAKIDAERAQSDIVFTAGPFGVFAHKRGEKPPFTREQWMKGRLTGRLKP